MPPMGDVGRWWNFASRECGIQFGLLRANRGW
jgi:hypothetical protein